MTTHPTTMQAQVTAWTAKRSSPHTSTDTDVERLRMLTPKRYDVRLVPQLPKQDMLLYSIGDIAWMLGRSPVTLRKWCKDQILPDTPLKYPMQNSPLEKPGTIPARRLFTWNMVLGIVRIAREEGVLEVYAKHIQSTQFTAKVAEMLTTEHQNEVNLQVTRLRRVA